MTAQEFINDMGVGWNLGNTFECAFDTYDHIQFKKYYSIVLSVRYGDTVYKITEKSIDAHTSTYFALSGALPNVDSEENIEIILDLKNTKLVSTSESPSIDITTASISNGINVENISQLIGEQNFSAMENSLSNFTYNTFFTLTEIKNKTITITGNLVNMPESSDPTAKQRLADLTPVVWGTPALTFVQLDAVKAAGFKTIRIPITWKDHISRDNIIDIEWLDKINTFVDYCVNSLGLYTIINMHHDDNETMGGWLYSDAFLIDTAMQEKYRAVWTQIATYFAGYPQDKLIFAGYNETRGTDHSWDTKKSENLYGIVKMGEVFYETVRAVLENEKRILIFPTYAAKVGHINLTFTKEDGTTAKFSIPDDEYCGYEVHIYETSYDTIKGYIDTVAKYDKPAFIGEFGLSSAGMVTESTKSQQFMVSYAKFNGIGAIVWDDYGGMGILKRANVTEINYTNATLWNGEIVNFIPYLVQASNLKETEILTSTRLFESITGDKIQLYIDSDTTDSFIIIEGNTLGKISNSGLYTAGNAGKVKILALSQDGYYGVCELTNKEPVAFVERQIDCDISNSALIKGKVYNKYNTNEILSNSRYHAIDFIEVAPSSELTVKCNNNIKIEIVEYTKGKNSLTKNYSEITDKYTGSKQVMSVNTYYIGINILNMNTDLEDNYLSIIEKTRDMDYIDFPLEERCLVASDFTQYSVSIGRIIEVFGNIDYTISLNSNNVDVWISELKKDKTIISRTLYKNGDSFVSNMFTKWIKIEITPNQDMTYKQLVNLFRNNILIPKLIYKDYVFSADYLINETCPEITENGTLKDDISPIYTINGKIAKINGKYIKEN